MPDLLDRPIVATEDARHEAERVKSLVFKEHRAGAPIVLHLSGAAGEGEQVVISEDLGRKLEEFLDALAKGHLVFVGDQVLGPAEAAELLNVEEPYLLKLHASGQLPAFRGPEEGLRFLRSAVLEYKRKHREARLNVLVELAEEGQKLNPRY